MIFWLNIFVMAAASALALLMLAAWLFGDRIAYPAPESTYVDTPEVIKLRIPGGAEISARFLENKGSDKCILYSHGNREDIFSISDTLERYKLSGYNVLAYEYCGYGTSEGPAKEESALKCADAAYDFLVRDKGFSPEKIAAVGFSIGSVTALHIASSREIGALVVVGGLAKSSYAILPFDLFFWSWLDNLSRAKKVRAPTLFLHGTEDKILPPRNGRLLYAACGADKKHLEMMEGFGHNKMPESQLYWDKILGFLGSTLR